MQLRQAKKFKQEFIREIDLERINGTPRLDVTPEGKKYPSMTSILKVMEGGGLDAWRERVGDEEADRICN